MPITLVPPPRDLPCAGGVVRAAALQSASLAALGDLFAAVADCLDGLER